MAKDSRSSGRSGRPQPTPPRTRSQRARDLAPYTKMRPLRREDLLKETEDHAKQVRAILRGQDGQLEWHEQNAERPPGFESQDMLVVRAWLTRRSVEAPPQAAALIKFPRMWSTKRGRYCNFSTPGAGSYGLMRARPSF
jgi:hypothetical protein